MEAQPSAFLLTDHLGVKGAVPSQSSLGVRSHRHSCCWPQVISQEPVVPSAAASSPLIMSAVLTLQWAIIYTSL